MVNDDINEAVSSLVFASSRCGELPELVSIRELFVQRYGQNYVTKALQLFPGHLVNLQVTKHFIHKCLIFFIILIYAEYIDQRETFGSYGARGFEVCIVG